MVSHRFVFRFSFFLVSYYMMPPFAVAVRMYRSYLTQWRLPLLWLRMYLFVVASYVPLRCGFVCTSLLWQRMYLFYLTHWRLFVIFSDFCFLLVSHEQYRTLQKYCKLHAINVRPDSTQAELAVAAARHFQVWNG